MTTTIILAAALTLSAPPADQPQTTAGETANSQETTSPSAATTASAPEEQLKEPVPASRAEWVAAIRSALRQEAMAEDVDRPHAVVRLISLYQHISADKTLRNTERVRLRQKLRARLVATTPEIVKDLRHRNFVVEAVERRAEEDNKPELLEKIKDDKIVLEKWDSVLAQVGGFGGGAEVGGGAAGGKLDHGEALVELIQKVITPDFWDVNGGPGSIVYWEGLRVLVVSATDEVHHQIGGLNEGLRRVGN